MVNHPATRRQSAQYPQEIAPGPGKDPGRHFRQPWLYTPFEIRSALCRQAGVPESLAEIDDFAMIGRDHQREIVFQYVCLSALGTYSVFIWQALGGKGGIR